MRTFLVAAVAAALAACAGAPPSAATPDDDGGRLYRSKCTACHRAYPPGERTRAQWVEVLTRMAPRAHLREDERAALLGWLDGRAKDAGSSERRPGPAGR